MGKTEEEKLIVKSVRFDQDTWNELEAIAKPKKISTSTLIRMICAEYLAKKEN